MGESVEKTVPILRETLFWSWAWPTMLVWAVVTSYTVYLYNEFDSIFGVIEIEELLTIDQSLSIRGVEAAGTVVQAMPIVAAVYMTSFVAGISAQYKMTIIGKLSNIFAFFLIARLLDYFIVIVMFIAPVMLGFFIFLFLSGGGSIVLESDITVLKVIANLAVIVLWMGTGAFSAAAVGWLFHRLAFIEMDWIENGWFMANVKGYMYGAVLLMVVALLTAWSPVHLAIYVATAGFFLLPLPHLWFTFGIWRKHYQKRHKEIAAAGSSNRFLVAASLVLVFSILFSMFPNAKGPPMMFYYYLTDDNS